MAPAPLRERAVIQMLPPAPRPAINPGRRARAGLRGGVAKPVGGKPPGHRRYAHKERQAAAAGGIARSLEKLVGLDAQLVDGVDAGGMACAPPPRPPPGPGLG